MVSINYLFQWVRFIWTNISFKCFFSTQIQVVVLCDQFLKLRLNIRDLTPTEFKFIQRNISLSQVSEESKFFRSQDEKCVSFSAFPAGGSAYAMNVLPWIIWGVKLNNPIDIRDVEPPGGHVGTQENTRVGVTKLEKGRCSFGLLLLALKIEK